MLLNCMLPPPLLLHSFQATASFCLNLEMFILLVAYPCTYLKLLTVTHSAEVTVELFEDTS